MSSGDVPRDIRDGGDYVSRFVDSYRWLLELDLLGDV
jgi:hypothetical protein